VTFDHGCLVGFCGKKRKENSPAVLPLASRKRTTDPPCYPSLQCASTAHMQAHLKYFMK